MVGRIAGLDAKKPAEIDIGVALKAEFIYTDPGPDQKAYLVFRP